jgi:delta 1-pyrroline-5-carboxylate dehydrogenase
MQYGWQNIIPVTLELGGKSPNIFFADVLAENDDFADKSLEGFTMFALNQGEVCTCPSRALVERPIYDEFLEAATIRTKPVRQGDPLDSETMIGAQASTDQLEKILSYIDIGKAEGARVVLGGERVELGGHLSGGYYVQPTIFAGDNRMRVFEEEIFGPVVSVTQFDGEDDAVSIANGTLYGLGAGVWTRHPDVAPTVRTSAVVPAGDRPRQRTVQQSSGSRRSRERGGSAACPTATAPIGSQSIGRSRTSRTTSWQNSVLDTQHEPSSSAASATSRFSTPAPIATRNISRSARHRRASG